MVWKSPLAIIIAASGLSNVAHALPNNQPKKTHYPGWAQIKHIFAFGDSYTTTAFNVSLSQPAPGNPLGNPTYPGHTSSNGPNWIDCLTTIYNKSFVETVNLAYGGATIDSTLVTPYSPTVLSVKEQVESEYLPIYASHFSPVPWSSDDTLFAIFIGINDIGNSYASQNATLLPTIFSELSGLVDKIYLSGARNFLFLNVPPVDRSPLTQAAGPSAQSIEAADVADWNNRLVSLSNSLTWKYKDATSFVFDTNKVFSRVIDHPCAYPQTCPYQKTTTYCTAYENGTSTPTSFDPACGVSVDKYLWLNSLRPTFRTHEVIAEQIVKLIK
ncbi:carbohydrate esterase family 16 protein, partial [Aureobasidium melanogenum]